MVLGLTATLVIFKQNKNIQFDSKLCSKNNILSEFLEWGIVIILYISFIVGLIFSSLSL